MTTTPSLTSKGGSIIQYPNVTIRDVENLLVSIRLDHGRIHPITGGWSYWTFEVEHRCYDGHAESSTPGWIFRFPRNTVVAENLRKEQTVLPVVASRVDFAVPRFEHVGTWHGQPYARYRRIPGRFLSGRPFTGVKLAAEVAGSIAEALCSLHEVPTSLVADACGVEPTIEAWRHRYHELRDEVRENLMPMLESTIADAVERGYDRFLDVELATLEDVALVHCDLGCEHILIEEDGTNVTGLIDFEDVSIGDPAIDFVGIYVTYGMETVVRIRDGYQRGSDGQCAKDVNFVNRLRFYTWMASCHEVIYGLEEGKSDLVEDGIAGLQYRLGHAGLI